MIRVTTVDGTRHDIGAATWHVDEIHGLHLKTAGGEPSASFAPGKWVAVEKRAERVYAPRAQ